MKKVFVILFLLIGLCAQGVVLKGGVHYTVESAREEAFSRVKYKISMDEHKKYLQDPGFSLDKNGKPKIRTFGRDVTFFDSGKYSIAKGKHNYYYNKKNGQLEYFEYVPYRYSFPNYTAKYDISGALVTVIFNVRPHESFVYDSVGKYLGRWVDELFYDDKGIVSGKREK